MSKFMGSKTMRAVVSVGMLAVLAACGGGGSDGDGSVLVSVKGTAATGAPLPGAAIQLTCANGTVLSGTSQSDGSYAMGTAYIKYPCMGSATLGAIKYRGVLLQGTVANFTPLTEILTEVILAASVSGSAALTLDQFVAKIRSDSTFAQSVIVNAQAYRDAVITVVQTQLKAEGLTDAQITTTLAAIASGNVDSAAFVVGDAIDKVLDAIAGAVLDASKNVDLTTQTIAKSEGDKKPTPSSSATGGSGSGG